MRKQWRSKMRCGRREMTQPEEKKCLCVILELKTCNNSFCIGPVEPGVKVGGR